MNDKGGNIIAKPSLLRQRASLADPLTYGVDALRAILLGEGRHVFPLAIDLAVLAGFAAIIISAASIAFSRRK